MMAEMMQALHELPEYKVGLFCPCGGNLETITNEFSVEAEDRIGAKEIVRCVVCRSEFDVDNQERLKAVRKVA